MNQIEDVVCNTVAADGTITITGQEYCQWCSQYYWGYHVCTRQQPTTYWSVPSTKAAELRAWLDGFLAGKAKLTEKQLALIRKKLEEF